MNLLTITCEGPHAPDLGWLLHKNPASIFERETGFGRLRVFYPESGPDRATAALLVDVDPVALVRRGAGAQSLEEYVNDRPYAASSFTSVALREAFGTALGGRCKERPELAGTPLPLRARVSAVRAGEDGGLARRLFEPLGYSVRTTAGPLDARFPAWGAAPACALEVAGTVRLADLLSHLYVLLPVLDNAKHYYVGESEVEKLVDHGEGWLAAHPEKRLVTARYLRYKRSLVEDALSQLTLGQPEEDAAAGEREEALEAPARLHDVRLEAVVAALREGERPPRRVVDMGCGEGKLLALLLEDRAFSEMIGVDVSSDALARCAKRLRLDRRPPAVRERVKLLQGSLLYRDARLEGVDAVALVEVIEHIDPARLEAARRVLFERIRPSRVVLTTPNREYNVRFEGLAAGKLRHGDHRFEWTRAELREWAAGAAALGYDARFSDVGPVDPEVGAPSQMAVFERKEALA